MNRLATWTAIGIVSMSPATLTAQTASYDPAPGARLDYAALREEAAERLSEYLRINTTNLPGNELAAARWLQQTLAREGIESQILDTAALGPGRERRRAKGERRRGKGER